MRYGMMMVVAGVLAAGAAQAQGNQPASPPLMPKMCVFLMTNGSEMKLPCMFDGIKKVRELSADEMKQMMQMPAPPAPRTDAAPAE